MAFAFYMKQIWTPPTKESPKPIVYFGLSMYLVGTTAVLAAYGLAMARSRWRRPFSLNGSFITAETLGNDAGVRRPDVLGLVRFCLLGLGADVDDARLHELNARLSLPKPATAKRAPKKRVPARKRS